MSDISPNVVILTRNELRAREDAAYQRGVERGKFEATHVNTKVARNCKYWRAARLAARSLNISRISPARLSRRVWPDA